MTITQARMSRSSRRYCKMRSPPMSITAAKIASWELSVAWNPLNLSEFSFLVRERGKFRLDLARECINGAEIFWNACSFRRGSVIILLEGEFDLAPILRRCAEISIDETPNMGNSPAATKLAKRAMSEGQIAVLFSASNGIEWMDIYAPEAVQAKILKLADEINGDEI